MNPIQINLTNLRSNDLTVLLTVNNTTASTANVTGITVNTPTSITAITNNTIYASNINGGRLYFCDGPIGETPIGPHTDYYYGWIEFSQMPSDCPMTGNSICQYWVNLSNVDITGMQIALSGTDINGATFSVGYESGATEVINTLSTLFPLAVKDNKIIAPNNRPNAYPSYDSYVSSLTATTAGMVITSDDSITFSGSFCNYADSGITAYTTSNVIVLLTDVNGNTIKITEDSLTTDIIYQCDGGHLYYNDVQWPQNRGDNGPTVITTNSVFREIMLGLNEGYFAPNETINNCSFPTLVPFTNGGNQYAQVIHGLSNSYGFPYADSNLKVLITALAGTEYPLSVTICDDTTPVGYSNAKSTSNAPKCGSNTLGIGNNSELGVVVIGECTYSQMVGETYSGFLPEMTGWNKMYFSGLTGPYIWINADGTGSTISVDAEGNQIVTSSSGGPFWALPPTGIKCLSLGANSAINPIAGPCINPPTPPKPPTGFWKWLEEMWFMLLLWNKWTK